MRALAYPLAVLLVLALPLVVVGAAAGAYRWGCWAVRCGGVVGMVGIVLCAGATANLVVARTCDDGGGPAAAPAEVNRPVLSLAVGDGECFRTAVAQAAIPLVAAAATSVAVVLVRQGRRAGDGASPFVPLP